MYGMMTEKALVSVIVPVYNVEKYLDRCVRSIVCQTYHELEILLIDDGSPDNCPQMCDEWAKRDSRIRVIHKENRGLGLARNTGINNAAGKYICFFDSDDYIAPDTIELAMDAVQKEEADLAIYGFAKVGINDKEISRTIPSPPKYVYQGREVCEELLPGILSSDPETGCSFSIPMSACSMMISMELIRRIDWLFVSEREIISEDIYSLLLLYANVQRVVVLNKVLYFYCTNPGSLTQVYREDRYSKNRVFYLKCIELCEKMGYSEKVKHGCIGPYIGNTMAALKQTTVNAGLFEIKKRIKPIVDDEVLQKVLMTIEKDKKNWKLRLMYWLMRRKCYGLCAILLKVQYVASGV